MAAEHVVRMSIGRDLSNHLARNTALTGYPLLAFVRRVSNARETATAVVPNCGNAAEFVY